MLANLENIDRLLLLWINVHHNSVLDFLLYYISQLWTSIPLFILWGIFIFKNKSLKKTLITLFSVFVLIVLTDQSSNQIKHAVKRYRPSHNTELEHQIHSVYGYKGGQYGFFSGHAANTFGVATFLCLLFSKRNRLFKSQFIIWAMVVSYTRIYLGVHYPSDIFVGMIDGLLCGFIVFKLTDLIVKDKFNETLSLP